MAVRTSYTNIALLRRILLYLVLATFVGYFLVPIYMVLLTSFKPFAEVSVASMWLWPQNPSLQGFAHSLRRLGPNLLNSFFLVIPATIISALFGSVNGYVFSKFRFKYANLIFALILFGMFIPYQSILIPLVQFLRNIGVYGRLSGLIITHVIYGIPITTLMFRNFYAEIPDELLDAGFMDGLGIYSTYLRVMVPLSKPGFTVVAIWQFTSIWNDFLFAVTITQRPSVQPITVALQNLAGSQVVEWNVQMAGAIIAALPTLAMYILLGKLFIRGMLSGSVKG
ncbi:MAG: carbohydrate ABC transporter permease [Spirochaetaceae bacterium]